MNAWAVLGNTIANDILHHLASVGVGSGVLLFAFVHNMPPEPPSSLQQYWMWVRDSLQTSIPVRQPANHPNPTQPVIPAQPPK